MNSELLGACISSLGIGMLSVVVGLPASVYLIKHGDRSGWWGFAALVVAIVLIIAGVVIHEY